MWTGRTLRASSQRDTHNPSSRGVVPQVWYLRCGTSGVVPQGWYLKLRYFRYFNFRYFNFRYFKFKVLQVRGTSSSRYFKLNVLRGSRYFNLGVLPRTVHQRAAGTSNSGTSNSGTSNSGTSNSGTSRQTQTTPGTAPCRVAFLLRPGCRPSRADQSQLAVSASVCRE
jgi:hypothetical protein